MLTLSKHCTNANITNKKMTILMLADEQVDEARSRQQSAMDTVASVNTQSCRTISEEIPIDRANASTAALRKTIIGGLSSMMST